MLKPRILNNWKVSLRQELKFDSFKGPCFESAPCVLGPQSPKPKKHPMLWASEVYAEASDSLKGPGPQQEQAGAGLLAEDRCSGLQIRVSGPDE